VVSLTFYGGVNEIGGNKILLEDRDAYVLLDFGKSFTCGCDYFTGWLHPRRVNGIGDYFHCGLLPKIRGVYAEDLLKFTDLPYTEPSIDAIFLSHAHFDHIAHIQFVDPKIPVYLGEGTKLFMEAQEETSSFSDYGEHSYKTFRTEDKIQISNFIVEPIHVDHSIPGAYGFLIETSEGTVVYTGDLRVHGPRRDMTEEFIDRACESDPVAMICEGTRMVEVEKRKNYSEQQVKQRSDEVVSSTDKMVFFTHYSRDMDRFRSLYSVAKNNDRRIVISTKTAHLLSKLVDDKRLDLPDPVKDESILVYFKRKKSGGFEEKDYYLWERPFMDKMVTFETINEKQSEYVMDLNFYQFTELIDIKPDPYSHFIHSMSEPFSDEDIEDEIMHNWLKLFDLQFHQLHASGHMNRNQLGDIISKVNPKKVFPVHTENPNLFKRFGYNVQIVERESEYNIDL
jgi:ribonuclease J